MDCYANSQFKLEGNKLVSEVNLSAPLCVYERGDTTLGVRGCDQSRKSGVSGDEQDLWSYDSTQKSMINIHSGQCHGVAPPPPTPSVVHAFVEATVNGERLYAKLGNKSLNSKLAGAAFLGSGVHASWFDDFEVWPSK